MAGKRNRSRRNRRNRSRRMRNPSILRNLSTGLRGIQSTRSLTFAPKSVNAASGAVADSWLEKAFPYLVIAMKFVGSLISHPNYTATSVAISSTIQSILISCEDILYDHPITTPSDVTVGDKVQEVMHIDYSIARLTEVKIVISLMGGISERAGRIAAVLIPLSLEKATELNKSTAGARDGEVVDFKQLTQKPGAIVSPNLQPLTIVRRTRGFTARRSMLGDSSDRTANLGYPLGGLPLFELIVGYQDMAALSSDPKLAYSLSEATLCVEISGNMILDAPVAKPRAMRSLVRTVFSANNVAAYRTGSRIPVQIPMERLKVRDGFLEVQEEVDSMADAFEQI